MPINPPHKHTKNKQYMGIKFLNKFLQKNCSKKAIRPISFAQCSHKTVVIDTSIYLYQFAAENAVQEQMLTLITRLKTHHIQPIFVFDGKPPPEKMKLLYERRQKKKEAAEEYEKIKAWMELNGEETQLEEQLLYYKKQSIFITEQHIQQTKDLLTSHNIPFYQAEGEADELCVLFVHENKAWACLSDDMDMLVYGCQRVLRNMDLEKQTFDLYDNRMILKELGMDIQTFRQIMVLSGTDYNYNENQNLYTTIKMYNKYKYFLTKHHHSNETFYSWLLKYTQYITDYHLLKRTYDIFDKYSLS